MARHRSWGRYASAFSSNTPWSSKARCRSFTAVTEVDLSYVPVVENGSLKEKWKQNKSVMKESYVSSVMKSLKLEFPLLEKLQLSLMAKRRVDVQCQMWHRHWKITQLWQKMRSLTYWTIKISQKQTNKKTGIFVWSSQQSMLFYKKKENVPQSFLRTRVNKFTSPQNC